MRNMKGSEVLLKDLLKQKINEALSSVLPITLIVLLLSFTNISPMPAGMLILFMLGAVMLIVGMGFFSLGADISMMPMGTETGRAVFGTNKLGIILPVCFFIGTAITVAEPDLQVLAHQFTAVPDIVIIIENVENDDQQDRDPPNVIQIVFSHFSYASFPFIAPYLPSSLPH